MSAEQGAGKRVVHSADDEAVVEVVRLPSFAPEIGARTHHSHGADPEMNPLPSRPIDIDAPTPEGNARRW